MRADDQDALRQLQSISNPEAVHAIRHYLYFPHEQLAKTVASILRERGFAVEDRLGADNVNWLLLITIQAVPTESAIADMCSFLEQVAEANGGEHDGWDAEVVR